MKLARIADDRFHLAVAKLSTEPLPLRTAFKLKGISKAVREEYSKYEEVRQGSLKKYGLKNEDGSLKTDERQNVLFDAEGMKAFTTELAELTSIDIQLPTVKISELGDKVNLTLAEVELLDGVIVED